MSKLYLFLISALIAFVSIFGLDEKFEFSLGALQNSFRSVFIDTASFFEDVALKHQNQVEAIENLQKELGDERSKNLILTQEYFKLKRTISNKLFVDLNRTIETNSTSKNGVVTQESKTYTMKLDGKLAKTVVISYVDFSDFSRVILDFTKNDDKIRGLVFDNMAAGIVLPYKNKHIALLNNNEKCGYSVNIGAVKAPGVTAGIRHTNLLSVKFIPVWMKISIGDEVTTSGMDGIFFEGLKVGKVIKVERKPMYQEATVMPNQEALTSRVFLIYSNN